MGDISVRLFGPPRVEVGGRLVNPDTRKAIAMLAYLTVSERPQPREGLAGLLWPDLEPERGRATLRRTLSALKASLGGSWVDADRAMVRLDLPEGAADVPAFRRLAREVADHEPSHEVPCEECLARLEDAATLSALPFMQGFSVRDSDGFDSWMLEQAAALERERVRVLDRLIAGRAESEDLFGAIDVAVQRLALDGLSEETHRRLMELYAAAGDVGAAIAQYRTCVTILDKELGVAPLPETVAIYESVLRGSATPAAAAPRRDRTFVREVPLVGRRSETERLEAVYTDCAGRGRVAVIEGEAGVGKSRLAKEIVGRAEQAGAAVIQVRCMEGEEAISLAAITTALEACMQITPLSRVEPHALRAVAALLPWLEDGTSSALQGGDPSAQIRLFEGIRSVLTTALSGSAPGILFVDDAQWVDPSSLEVLGYLARRLEAHPILLLLAWRSEVVPREHPLNSLVRAPAERIALGRLDPNEVEVLLRALVDDDELQVGDAIQHVRVNSEGLPLFVVEYAAALGTGRADVLPANVRDLIRSKLAGLPETSKQLLSAAAVIERDVSLDDLAEVTGRSEAETAEGLDALVAQQVFVSGSEDGLFRFSHGKIREFAYEDMGPARRQVLHRRYAALLTHRRGRDTGAVPAASIARHLVLAGQPRAAAVYHAHAGDEARAKLAHDDAVRHYEEAIALGHERTDQLNEALGDVHRLRGNYGEALQRYENAAAIAHGSDLARLEHKLGDVYARRGEWMLARAHFEQAIAAAGDDHRRYALATSDLALAAHRLGIAREAQALADRSLEQASVAGDDGALAQAHNVMGMLAHARGEETTAVRHLEQSLNLAQHLGDPSLATAAINNLALAHRAAGNRDAAIAATADALELCARVGDRHREAALHNNMADLMHEQGDRRGALEHLRQASRLFGEIGYEREGPLPEVWKLVSW